MIVQVGLCHRTAPVSLLEQLRQLPSAPVANRNNPSHVRCVPVATCHRLELYTENVSEGRAIAAWREWLGLPTAATLPDALSVRTGPTAGRHLLRVAAGLESAVLGEDQVLAQLRAAYREACARGSAGPLLHRLFHASFRTGRRVRGETALAGGSRSLSAAAVNYLDHQFGSLSNRRVLVAGCGTMGALAARRLAERGVGELLVSNRTWQKAVTLAARLGSRPVPWQWRAKALQQCDAVICAAFGDVMTGPDLDLAAAVGRLRIAIDLGMPRNISVTGEAPRGCELVNLATLSAHLDEARSARSAAVQDAEAILEEELAAWWRWTVARGERRGHRENGVAAG